MPMKMTAREYLIATAKELMSTKNLDQISVAEILEASGVSRTTFYKHFRDKQDLVESILLSEIVAPSFHDKSRTFFERELEVLKNLDANRAFFCNAFKSEEFLQVWEAESLKANICHIKAFAHDKPLDEKRLLLYAKIMTYVSSTATIDWVYEEQTVTAEEYAHTLAAFFSGGFGAVLNEPPEDAADAKMQSEADEPLGSSSRSRRQHAITFASKNK